MHESDLDSIFDSFVFNDLKTFGDPCIQRRVWIEGNGPEVGEFEDDIGFVFEYSECLFEKYDELSTERQKYLDRIKVFYEMTQRFYHNIFRKNPNNKIENFMQHPEWQEIQHLANTLYQEIKGEPWWKY